MTEPVLRIVRGVPDGVDASVEVAVITAVLASRGGPVDTQPRAPSPWNAPDRLLDARPAPGPDGWRRAALPH